MSSNAGSCGPIDGNPDFYGLGIRIGVYLQWISAWLNLLVDPNSAQSTYDTNSVFVFAITIATIVAALSDATQPIEIYIMLQITIGFFVTSLSTMGVRFYFLSPDRLAQLLDRAQNSAHHAYQAFRSARQEARRGAIGAAFLAFLTLTIPLKIFSPLKPVHLSWSGVVWRMVTAVLIASFNIFFWFRTMPTDNQPSEDGCGSASVFMFSKQQLHGPIVILGRISAVVIAVFIYTPAYPLLLITVRFILYSILFLSRDILYLIKPDLLKPPKDRINRHLAKKGFSFPEISAFGDALPSPFGLLSPFSTWSDFIGFFSTPSAEAIHFSDILKAIVSLGTGKVFVMDQRVTDREGRSRSLSWTSASPTYRTFCLVWNALVLAAIAWFILSIEFTLSWNDIQGVHSIDNTGQLIPLVIGCVNASQAIKKGILLVLAKIFPDWANVRLEAHADAMGRYCFQIMKEDDEDGPGEGVTAGEPPLEPTLQPLTMCRDSTNKP